MNPNIKRDPKGYVYTRFSLIDRIQFSTTQSMELVFLLTKARIRTLVHSYARTLVFVLQNYVNHSSLVMYSCSNNFCLNKASLTFQAVSRQFPGNFQAVSRQFPGSF